MMMAMAPHQSLHWSIPVEFSIPFESIRKRIFLQASVQALQLFLYIYGIHMYVGSICL